MRLPSVRAVASIRATRAQIASIGFVSVVVLAAAGRSPPDLMSRPIVGVLTTMGADGEAPAPSRAPDGDPELSGGR